MTNTNSRVNPEPTITMKLAPQASPVNTAINPVLDRYAGAQEANSALETANSLKNFMGTVDTVNKVAMDMATQTAQQEYLQNKTDWASFSEKHPFMSHLNPHIQNSFAKMKADEEASAIQGTLASKIKDDMPPEEYQALMRDTKSQMYQAYTKNGVTMYDLEGAAKKLNEVEQQSNASYYAQHAKYQYETVKNGLHSEGLKIVGDSKLDLPTRIANLQTLFDNNLDVNSIDKADVITKILSANLDMKVSDLLYDPEEEISILKNFKINGKSITEVKPEMLGDTYKLVEDYSGRRTKHLIDLDRINEYKQEKSAKDFASNMINLYADADTPAKIAAADAQFDKGIKDGDFGIYSNVALGQVKQFSDYMNDRKSGAKEDDIPTFSLCMTKAAQGKLTEAFVMTAVNNKKLTRDTAKSLLSHNISIQTQQGKEDKSKFLTKGISNYFTKDYYYNSLGYSKMDLDFLPEDERKIIDNGYNGWKDQYNFVGNQSYQEGNTNFVGKEFKSYIQDVKSQLSTYKADVKANKTTDKKEKPATWWSGKRPADGEITSSFGNRNVNGKTQFHQGNDFEGKEGDPARCISNGIILDTGFEGSMGNYVTVKHPNGFISKYMHLKDRPSKNSIGRQIAQGQLLGTIGSTGRTRGGANLHVGLWDAQGNLLDLKKYIQ